MSLCLHEYAHALVAYPAGDRGVAERGYLRLNPLKYTHPVLSIVLPIIAVILGGIGLPGGAVWVDHAHIRSRGQAVADQRWPARLTNVVFALVLAVPFLPAGAEDRRERVRPVLDRRRPSISSSGRRWRCWRSCRSPPAC